jgi:acyl-CoA thioesterase
MTIGGGHLPGGGDPDPGAGAGAGADDAGTSDFWLQRQLGFHLETERGRAVASLDCDERHLNPHGTVHGAVLFALVDTGMGAATMSVLGEARCATIEIHTRFLAPVFGGPIRADVGVLKAGRRIVHLEATVTDARGDIVARADGSFAVLPPAADGSGYSGRA